MWRVNLWSCMRGKAFQTFIIMFSYDILFTLETMYWVMCFTVIGFYISDTLRVDDVTIE